LLPYLNINEEEKIMLINKLYYFYKYIIIVCYLFFVKALDYYERAADLGQPNAIYNLGNSFMKGVMNKKRI
jgi:TPR repeat protein